MTKYVYLLLMATGCGVMDPVVRYPKATPTPQEKTKQAVSRTRDANPQECEFGGFVFELLLDENGNSVADDEDKLINKGVSCHGKIGKDGKDGVPGAASSPSPIGSPGPQGSPGATGSTGPQGPTGATGQPGSPGNDGVNGHSIVSNVGAVPLICINGGQSTDFFLDLDDSLTYTVGDQYTNSIFVCNGINGSGSSTPYSFGANTICQVVDTNLSARKPSNNSNNVDIYNGLSCAGASLSTLASTTNEVYWISNSKYFSIEGASPATVVRKVVLQ